MTTLIIFGREVDFGEGRVLRHEEMPATWSLNNVELLKEDLLQVEDRRGDLVDVGWFPSGRPAGSGCSRSSPEATGRPRGSSAPATRMNSSGRSVGRSGTYKRRSSACTSTPGNASSTGGRKAC